MRYTYSQYNSICDDVAAQIKAMKRLHIFGREPFMCDQTACSFCPFREYGGRCPDAGAGSPYDRATWPTARTAEEWKKWLGWFATNNDPDRPYTIEIPATAVDDIHTALTLNSVDTATAKLLESIQKQINEQN